MKQLLGVVPPAALIMSCGVALADSHESDAGEANVASPMETYACTYNEGKGPADLDAATDRFNAWADRQGIDDYSAWTLVPFYSGPDQDFDVLWFGASDKAASLGRVQDTWLATGSAEAEGFAAVMTCNGHSAYSVLTMKEPPESSKESNFIATFSDCVLADGVTFGEMYVPIVEWGKYTAEHGSTAGHWVFFPFFGGGNEDFDFKWVSTSESFEALGADWDKFNEGGWRKSNELFLGKLSCDSSRAYVATKRRSAAEDE